MRLVQLYLTYKNMDTNKIISVIKHRGLCRVSSRDTICQFDIKHRLQEIFNLKLTGLSNDAVSVGYLASSQGCQPDKPAASLGTTNRITLQCLCLLCC